MKKNSQIKGKNIFKIILIFFFCIQLLACSEGEPINTQRVNKLLLHTDSLYDEITGIYTSKTDDLKKYYFKGIPKDSIPDSILIHNSSYIHKIRELSKIYDVAQREIIFTHDHLFEVKQGIIKGEIDKDVYNEKINKEEDIVKLLTGRIDSMINIIENKFRILPVAK